MTPMTRFTHDLETVELSDEECAAYGRLVDNLCNSSDQRGMSAYLSAVTRPQSATVLGVYDAVAPRLWRTEARL